MTPLPGVTTRASKSRPATDVVTKTPAAKRTRVQTTTPSTAAPAQPNLAFEQWLDDVANVDISLSISVGSSQNILTEEKSEEQSSSSFSVSIPNMLTRVLQSKLAIDPSRLQTNISPTGDEASEVFVALTVKGREEPIAKAIEGGLTPRKAYLRSAPHISRVASRLQDCMRQMFGMKDFVVRVD